MIELPVKANWGDRSPMGGGSGPADEHDCIREGRKHAKLLRGRARTRHFAGNRQQARADAGGLAGRAAAAPHHTARSADRCRRELLRAMLAHSGRHGGRTQRRQTGSERARQHAHHRAGCIRQHATGPLVVDFLHQHPELSLNVELSDRSVDLIEEGYDLAIRTSPTTGAGLVAWPLMPLDYVLCAAPSLSCPSRSACDAGRPRRPPLHHRHRRTGCDWRFTGSEGRREVPIYGRLQVNNAMLRCDAARAGAGVLLCAEYLVEGDFANGRLVRLLPDHTPAGSTLHAVSPAYRAGSPKVRSLVNHLTSQLGEPHEAAGPTPRRLLLRARAELSAGEARGRPGRGGGRGGTRAAGRPGRRGRRGVPHRRAAPARGAARRLEEAVGGAAAGGVPGAARVGPRRDRASGPRRLRRSSG